MTATAYSWIPSESNKFQKVYDESPPLTIRIDETSETSVTYIGHAILGSITSSEVWRIKKIDETGSVTIITFADADDNFDNIWDNRTSLSYG